MKTVWHFTLWQSLKKRWFTLDHRPAGDRVWELREVLDSLEWVENHLPRWTVQPRSLQVAFEIQKFIRGGVHTVIGIQLVVEENAISVIGPTSYLICKRFWDSWEFWWDQAFKISKWFQLYSNHGGWSWPKRHSLWWILKSATKFLATSYSEELRLYLRKRC